MPNPTVHGSVWMLHRQGIAYSAIDFGARVTKTAAQNRTAIIAALSAANTAGGGVVIAPQGITHNFDPAVDFPVTANYLTVLQWTGGTYRVWCNQDVEYEIDGNLQVNKGVLVSGTTKLYGAVAESKLLLAPTSGQSIQVPDGCQNLILNPAANLAALTIVFPPNPVDGSRVRMFCNKNITTLTLSPSAGQSFSGAPVTHTADGSVEFLFNKTASGSFTANTWYRSR